VKYTGILGEFRWWGFVISVGLCLGFALFLFTRFQYVKEDAAQQDQAEIVTLKNQVSDLHVSTQSIEKRLAVQDCQIQFLIAKSKKGNTPADPACNNASH